VITQERSQSSSDSITQENGKFMMIDPLVSSLFFLFLSAKYIQVSCQVKLWVRKRDSPTFHHKIQAVYKCSLDVYLMRHTSYSLPPTVDMWSLGGHLQSRTVISNDDVCELVKNRRANSCCWWVIPLCTFSLCSPWWLSKLQSSHHRISFVAALQVH